MYKIKYRNTYVRGLENKEHLADFGKKSKFKIVSDFCAFASWWVVLSAQSRVTKALRNKN